MVIYALLGSSRQLSVGSESTTAVLTTAIVAPLASGDVRRYAGIAALRLPAVLRQRAGLHASGDDRARRQPSQPEWFLLSVEAIVEAEITGLDALDAVRSRVAARGIVFALAGVKQDLRGDLEAYGLVSAIGAELLFPTLSAALDAFAQRRDRPAETGL